jgi:MYXO-CTERM domain-containing protein
MPDEDMGTTPDMGDMPDLGVVDQPDMDQSDMGQPDMGQADLDEGCGCASANAPSNGILALLLLAFFIRRRLGF